MANKIALNGKHQTLVSAGGDNLFTKNKTAINKNTKQLLEAHLKS
jgi:hypothetical protein